MTSDKGVVERLTKAQTSRLSYLSKEHVGGRALIAGPQDLSVYAQMADKGLVTVIETRPGFYAAHITDKGRAALMPAVLNKHRDKIPPDAVYIGRGSPWGNPFKIGRDGTRDEVCDRFEREVLPTLDIEPLRYKTLVCFCAPARCHGHSILKALRERERRRL